MLIKAEQQPLPDDKKSAVAECKTELDRFLNEALPKRISELSQLQRRFCRSDKTFNIGIVGNARQGKSTFLQALTGLGDDVIPSAAEDHCTGAPSIIVNRPDFSDEQTYADIEFYTESDFFDDVIVPFYRELNLPKPPTYYDWVNNLVPEPSREYNATDGELYKKLKERRQQIGGYKDLLNQPNRSVRRNEIFGYIAQQDMSRNKLA